MCGPADAYALLRILIAESSRTQATSFWTEIVKALRNVAYPVSYDWVQSVRRLLVDALLKSPCKNRDTAVRMVESCARCLHVTCAHRLEREPVISCWGIKDRHETLARRPYEVSSDHLSWIMDPVRVSNEVRLPLRYVRAASERKPGCEGAACLALIAGDEKLLAVLVRYGFWNGAIDTHDIAHWMNFRSFWEYLRERIAPMEGLEHGPDMVWWRKLVTNHLLTCDNQRGFKRIVLILKTMEAQALLSKPGVSTDAEQYMRCLGAYFAALPDPMVSADEVREFLQLCLTSSGEQQHGQLQRIQQTFDTVVDEWADIFGRQPYRPRSLKHLCRCSVRNALADNKSGVLPGLVDQLPIPRILKDFVLCVPETTSS